MSNDWVTLFWFFASLGFLALLIIIFWFDFFGETTFYQPSLNSPPLINQDKLVIQLEKAEISKVSEIGKEWEIHTDNLSKDEQNIYLNGVKGSIYQQNKPFYQLEAEKGRVNLETSDAWFQDVRLVQSGSQGYIVGKFLSWLGKERFMKIENAFIEKDNMLVESKYLWYDLSQRIITLRENVIIILKAEENI